MSYNFKRGDMVTPTRYVGNAGPGDLARVTCDYEDGRYLMLEWIYVAKNHQNDGGYRAEDFVITVGNPYAFLMAEVKKLRDLGHTVEVTVTPPCETITL